MNAKSKNLRQRLADLEAAVAAYDAARGAGLPPTERPLDGVLLAARELSSQRMGQEAAALLPMVVGRVLALFSMAMVFSLPLALLALAYRLVFR